MSEFFDINAAINLLKEKIILKDNLSSKFVYKNKRIYVYGINSSYNLSLEDFLDLFRDNKFMIEEFDDCAIDLEKDREYYSFKHK